MKKLKITTTERDFYLKYLLMMDSVFNIRPSARLVFAEIMFFYNLYSDLPEEERASLTFNKKVKAEIQKRTGLSQPSIDNQLTYLRKKSLVKGLTVNKKYWFSYDTHKETLFSFKIEADDMDGYKVS